LELFSGNCDSFDRCKILLAIFFCFFGNADFVSDVNKTVLSRPRPKIQFFSRLPLSIYRPRKRPRLFMQMMQHLSVFNQSINQSLGWPKQQTATTRTTQGEKVNSEDKARIGEWKQMQF